MAQWYETEIGRAKRTASMASNKVERAQRQLDKALDEWSAAEIKLGDLLSTEEAE